MCGRYYIDQEDDIAEMRQILDEINRRFYGDEKLQRLRTGEIFPTNVVPVLKQDPDSAKIVPDLMLWGFPHFKGSGVIINARAETAGTKPMFRRAAEGGRILIPASAFFEWSRGQGSSGSDSDGLSGENAGRQKRKFKLSWQQEPTFYMAGLYRDFPDPKHPDKMIGSFVILTTDANPSVARLHNRMPLILPREMLRTWVGDTAETSRILAQKPQMQLELTESA